MKQDDADLLELLDYLDGRLVENERIAFELRLAEEPALAAERDAFERLDHLQRMAIAARRAGRPGFTVSAAGRALLALAAVALAFLGVRWWLVPGAAEPGFEVAILPSGPTLPEHNVRLGLGEDDVKKVPPGFRLRAAGDELETVPLDEYLALTSGALDQRMRQALDRPAAEATAATFVVLVRCQRESSAVVLVVGSAGASLAYPAATPWTATSGRLAASGVHVLPEPLVQVLSEPTGARIAYEPGFFVPRGAGAVDVLVGLREAPLDSGLRSVLERAAAESPSVEGLSSRLVANGFDVRRLIVREE